MFRKILFQITWRYRELTESLFLRTNKTPVVVYTMGKVGSTSLYLALKKKLGWRVMFAHRLLEENIEEYDEAFINQGIKPHRSIKGKLIYKRRMLKNKPIKFITLVRDPFARNLSDFFQDFKVYNNKIEASEWNNNIDQLKSNFLKNYPRTLPLDWFQKDCYKGTGIDVYITTFNNEVGYQIYQSGNVSS